MRPAARITSRWWWWKGRVLRPAPRPHPARRGAGTRSGGRCGLWRGGGWARAGAWFSRSLWVPQPVVEKPRVLAVGRGAAYPSMAAALAAARAGDTIDVAAGEYSEQVHLGRG